MFSQFIKNKLLPFTDILKKNIENSIEKKDKLTIHELINCFLIFFENNSAFYYFIDDKIEKDEMIFSLILQGPEKRLYSEGNYNLIEIERKIRIKELDEEFQIQLELYINMPYVDTSVEKYFEIERDADNRFFHWKSGDTSFNHFKNQIYSSEEIISVLNFDIYLMGINISYDL